MENQKPWWKSDAFKVGLALALIAGVFTIIGALAPGLLSGDSSKEKDDSNAAASPVESPVKTPSRPTRSGSDDPSVSPAPTVSTEQKAIEDEQDPEPTEPPPATQAPRIAAKTVEYLSDIEETNNKTATLVYQGAPRECLTSLMIRTNIFQDVKTLEYPIGPEWDTFKVLAGMDTAPPSGNTMRFTVYVDDEQVAAHKLSDREAVEISVPVKGKSNLKLVTETIAAGKTPAGGYGAWGNARFTAGSREMGGC